MKFIQILKNIVKRLKKITFSALKKAKTFIFADLRKVLKNFEEHDGELSTCAIAFFLLISFIPASLVIISILSYFYESGEMASFFYDLIETQLPSIDIGEFRSIIDKIIISKRWQAFIWVPFLFWWGSLVFDILERVLEKAFRVAESRKYWKAKIRHFIIIIGMGAFVLTLTLMSNLIAIIKNSGITRYIRENLNNIIPAQIQSVLIDIGNIPFVLTSLTTLFMNTLFVFIMYRFVPPKRIDNASIFKGALFASLSYEIIKSLFSYYITQINDYSSIFGPLSTIVILMIWIWYTCFLFVIGAEAAWMFFDNKQERSGKLNFDGE
ncbi:MAG: YihY/virulence factor BrkB family protein [bacterium]|nr:YihY/virulence factor BrkB family protein [bacterium]